VTKQEGNIRSVKLLFRKKKVPNPFQHTTGRERFTQLMRNEETKSEKRNKTD
jgi:hypothetical protein